eukprot:TRINITY_DN8214_c1_g1_i1.p1 TRINITY_DN8214_c1_g1~~TRINITY_DN8214_c1_g1_i1.p1  ORF type:complete len:269 (+),score=130.57 TRINITY_DN8214_c1_g1_i1:55-861(+)
MAIGKNKRLSKGGKKSTKRKVGDVMLNKEWYDVVAPASFHTRQCSKTVVNKSKGTFNAADSLKGRVFEVCLADLMTKAEAADDNTYKSRKVQLKAEEVQGRNVLTNFHGMSLTTDKLRSLLSKWCTLIEGSVEVKTSDGYTLRVFAIAFTKKRQLQVKKNCHCQTSHVKKIRTKMAEIITQTVSKSSLEKVVKNLQQDVMGDEIKKACAGIFPLRDVNIRKVKVVKVPKQSLDRLMEAHGGAEGVPKSVEGGRQKMADKPAEVEEADE